MRLDKGKFRYHKLHNSSNNINNSTNNNQIWNLETLTLPLRVMAIALKTIIIKLETTTTQIGEIIMIMELIMQMMLDLMPVEGEMMMTVAEEIIDVIDLVPGLGLGPEKAIGEIMIAEVIESTIEAIRIGPEEEDLIIGGMTIQEETGDDSISICNKEFI
jgi:hypothetical protein